MIVCFRQTGYLVVQYQTSHDTSICNFYTIWISEHRLSLFDISVIYMRRPILFYIEYTKIDANWDITNFVAIHIKWNIF